MNDNTLIISKIGIRSVFTVNKYDPEILEDDLSRIIFIRNYIEECSLYVKEVRQDINTEEYFTALKKYALELFLIQCEDTISDVERNSECFNLKTHQKENADYFNYLFDNLKYPK